MEPFRPYVDRVAMKIKYNDEKFKYKLIDLLNYNTVIGGKSTTFDLAIRTYAKSVFQALANDCTDDMVFPEEVKFKNEL